MGLRFTTAPIASSIAFLKPRRGYSERMISTVSGVRSERGIAPMSRDLPVRISLLRQELRRSIGTVNLETVLANEGIDQAQVVQHAAEEEHLIIDLGILQHASRPSETIGSHDVVEEEGRRMVARQVQRGEAYYRIGMLHNLLLEAVRLRSSAGRPTST